MMSHAAPDESLLARLPLPLAQLYRRAHNAKTALERHLTAFYLWEASLKLLASAAIIDYASRGTPEPELTERLQNLARPALGHWWEFIRRLVPLLADRGNDAYRGMRELLLGRSRNDLPRTAALDAVLREVLDGKGGPRATVSLAELFDRLVQFRNAEVGHGAAGQRPGDFYERLGTALLAGLGELLARLDVLAGRRLLYVGDVRRLTSGAWLVDRFALTGEIVRRLESLEIPETEMERLPRPGRLYLAGPDADAAEQALYPLLLYDADTAQVFFLNARRGARKTDYLCYLNGAVVKRDELGDERRALLARVLAVPVDDGAVAAFETHSCAEESTVSGQASNRRTVGEFELLSRLGRGGMGVVYRAWQASLGRQVALKCLLRSGDPKAEARFTREIHALGRVEHPHVVKVFTSGIDGDQWYYAMELIEGADLGAVIDQLADTTAADLADDSWTKALSNARVRQREKEETLSAGDDLPLVPVMAPGQTSSPAPRHGSGGHVAQVVEIVRQAAEAAHALHEVGVVHRDIKPGNILLTLDGGHAVLMDLGLAQLTDETEGRLTRTRQFVGTLRYASPEQVLSAERLDRRADVYSLGATLWELLTLRPLFGAGEQTTTPELMLKIQTVEPERPRRGNRRVPPDLEAIVMKCLEKDRARRYATAADLAADLGRWQRGEPVLAQPPSLGYLLRKKVRRHRVPLAAAAGVLLAAIVGVVLAFLRINMALENVKDANNRSEQQRKDAVAALAEKEKAYGKLEAKEDELAGETARSWLLPLAMQPGPLSDQEIEVLAAVAAQRDERVTLRFLAEAVKEPRFTQRLRVRSDPALRAALGLDKRKRDKVEELLVARLQTPGIAADSRRDLALTLAALSDLSPSAARLAAPHLLEALARTTDSPLLHFLAKGLTAVAARLEAREAAALLTQAMSKSTEVMAVWPLAEGLAALAVRLEPKEGGALLTQALTRTKDELPLLSLVAGLSAVAARMEPKDAADLLIQAMTNTTDTWILRALGEGLAAVAVRMEPKEAVALLTRRMAATTGEMALWPLAVGLTMVAARLEPKEGAATLLQAMTKTADPKILALLASGLWGVVARMEATQAARVSADAAALLIPALAQMPDTFAASGLARELAAAAVWMEPKEAAVLLLLALNRTSDSSALGTLAKGLASVAARMEAKEAADVLATVAKTLAGAIEKARTAYGLLVLTEGLAAVVARMEPKDAAPLSSQAAGKLTETMTRETDGFSREMLAISLSLMTPWMEQREAVDKLTQALAATNDANTLRALALGLADRIGAKEAATTLSDAMTKTTDPYRLGALAAGLSAVAARLEPKEAARVSSAVAPLLIQAMTRETEPFAFAALGRGVAAVARWMKRSEAAAVSSEAAATLLQAMDKSNSPDFPVGVAQGLSAVAPWMKPREIVPLLTQMMAKATHIGVLEALAAGLEAVAARRESEDETRVWTEGTAVLTQTMTRTSNPTKLMALAKGVSALVPRMEATDAARVSAETAALLINAAARTADANLPPDFTRRLAILLGNLQRNHRVFAVATVAGCLRDGPDLPGSLVLLNPATEPLPNRPTDQALVELLKEPICLEPARRAVLNELGERYQRRFADAWEFLHFAEEHDLDFDFLSSPKRR